MCHRWQNIKDNSLQLRIKMRIILWVLRYRIYIQCDTKLFTIFLFYNICPMNYSKSNSLVNSAVVFLLQYSLTMSRIILICNHRSSWNRKWWRYHYFLQIAYLQLELWKQWNSDVFLKISLQYEVNTCFNWYIK